MARKQVTLTQFTKLLQDIVALLLGFVGKEMGKKKWKLAYYDVRSAGTGGARFGIFRVVLPNGKVVQSLSAPMDAKMILHKAWDMKDKVFKPKWHGLKLTIHPDGECKTEFNYDPDCASDPTFCKA